MTPQISQETARELLEALDDMLIWVGGMDDDLVTAECRAMFDRALAILDKAEKEITP